MVTKMVQYIKITKKSHQLDVDIHAPPAADHALTTDRSRSRVKIRISVVHTCELRRQILYIKPKSTQFWESKCDQWRSGAHRVEGIPF